MKIVMGDLVEISQLKNNRKTRIYFSRVEECKKNTVLIHTPISYGIYVKLPSDKVYSVKFIGKKGVLRHNAAIKKYKIEGAVHFTEIKLLCSGERIQQRDFFRLPCTIPFRFSISAENRPEKETPCGFHDGVIRDLSGGGMKIITKQHLAVNDIIKFNLRLKNTSFGLTGEVKYKFKNPHTVKSFSYGVMFVELSETVRERIIFYLHDLQLRFIRMQST